MAYKKGAVTAAANITDLVPVIGDGGVKGAKGYVTTIRNLVQMSRSQFTYSDADQITCAAAQYMCKDKYCYWVSTLTTNATGAVGGAESWYLYLDYSAITSGTAITASELIWSTTAPTFNTTYRQMMNGDDVCVFGLRTAANNSILKFYHDGGNYVEYSANIADLASTDIDLAFTDATLTIPNFGDNARANVIFGGWFNTSGGLAVYYRKNGGAATTNKVGYVASGTINSYNSRSITVDATQKIEVAMSSSGDSQIEIYTEGFYLPSGM